jgi:hypothetical protein
MTIDLQTETLLSFREAAARLPGRPGLSTLHRWRLRGVRGVKLETWLIGGRRFTSQQALERFASGTTAAASDQPMSVSTRRQHERAVKRAEQELEYDDI